MGRVKLKRLERQEAKRRSKGAPRLVHVSGSVGELMGETPEQIAARHAGVRGPRGEELRARLMERVREGVTGETEVTGLIQAFRAAGLGPVSDELHRMAGDDGLPLAVRGLAFEVWAHGPGDQIGFMMDRLGVAAPKERMRWFLPMVAGLLLRPADPSGGERLGFLTVATGPLPRLFDTLEEARAAVGVEALTAYAPLLACEPLADVHRRLLDAIVDEAAPDAHACLSWIRRCIPSDLTRRLLARAIVQLEAGAGAALH